MRLYQRFLEEKLSNPFLSVNQCRLPKIFQTMNSVRSNNHSLKYQGVKPLVYDKDSISKGGLFWQNELFSRKISSISSKNHLRPKMYLTIYFKIYY